MSWGNIMGTETILPKSGNSDEVIFESGKAKMLTVLLPRGSEPHSFFQHIFEYEMVDTQTGARTPAIKVVNCRKTKADPYAYCPLCEGQQVRRRIRHAAEVYDHELKQVKILAAGETVWKPIATIAALPGTDLLNLQFLISKTGQTRNDTNYAVTSMPLQMALPAGIQLRDMTMLYPPTSIEEMRATAESLKMNWDLLIVPPPIKYFTTLEAALAHKVPNTKYKGQTMQEIYQNNKGMIEFFANSNRVSEEKAAAQMILVAYEGANIPGVPVFSPSQTTAYAGYQGMYGAQMQQAAPQSTVQQAPMMGGQQVQGQNPVMGGYAAPAAQPQQPQMIINSAGNGGNTYAAQQAPTVIPATPAQPQINAAYAQVQQPVVQQPVVQQPVVQQPQINIGGQPQINVGAPAQPVVTGTPDDRRRKIDRINELLRTNKRVVAMGFEGVMQTVTVIGHGKSSIVEFDDSELDAMIAECSK
jgi:hypothetical protein